MLWILENDIEFSSTTKLQATRLSVLSPAPPRPLEALLALCSKINRGVRDTTIEKLHASQLWSQWLEVHSTYVASGLGYPINEEPPSWSEATSPLENLQDPLISSKDRGSAATTTLLVNDQSGASSDGSEDVKWGEQYNLVLDLSFLPGGQPELTKLLDGIGTRDRDNLTQLGRDFLAKCGANAGTWLTRVCCANQVGEILDNQHAWCALLGLETAPTSTVVQNEKLCGILPDVVGCKGIVIPGPSQGLLELFYSRAIDYVDNVNDFEGAAMALLPNHAFDVVSWGDYGYPAATQSQQNSTRKEASTHLALQFVHNDIIVEGVVECLLKSSSTEFLHTHVVEYVSRACKGLNDYNDKVQSFPLLDSSARSSLTREIQRRTGADKKKTLAKSEEGASEGDEEDEGEFEAVGTRKRRAELRLLFAERMAIMQVAISTFFAIAALLRAL